MTTIAVAMTLNVDAIYLATDPLLGGTNVTTLVADGLLMTGIFFLGARRPALVDGTRLIR